MTFLSVCIEPKRGGVVQVVMRWIRPLPAAWREGNGEVGGGGRSLAWHRKKQEAR